MRSTFNPAPPAAPTEPLAARATDSIGPPGRGAPPPSPGFASVLHQHVARTAVAEGQHKTATETGGHRASEAAPRSRSRSRSPESMHDQRADAGAAGVQAPTVQHPVQPAAASQPPAQPTHEPAAAQHTATQQPATEQAATQRPGTQQSAQAAPASSAQPAAAGAAQLTATLAAQLPAQAAQAQAGQGQAVPGQAGPGQAAGAQSGQPQTIQPQANQPQAQSSQTAQQQQTGSAQPAPAQPAPAPASPAHPSAATPAPATPQSNAGGHQGDQSGSQQDANPRDIRGALQSLLTQPAGAPATSAPAAVNLHAAPAAAGAQPAAPAQAAPAPQATAQPLTLSAPTPQATPASAPGAPASPAATAARYAVPLEHTVETVRMTVEAGVRQGFSQARIQLAPASLGQVRINLLHTSDGVVAKVVTEHQAAAQTLGQAGAELKRSLQDAGVNLIRLDIEARSDSGAASRDPNQPTSAGRAGSGQADDHAGAADTDDQPASGEQTLTLPSGVLVNVLA